MSDTPTASSPAPSSSPQDKGLKPDWWPQCPWPTDVWSNNVDEVGRRLIAAIGPANTTASSGVLMRHGWELALASVLEHAHAHGIDLNRRAPESQDEFAALTAAKAAQLREAVEKAFPVDFGDPLLARPGELLGDIPWNSAAIIRLIEGIKARVLATLAPLHDSGAASAGLRQAVEGLLPWMVRCEHAERCEVWKQCVIMQRDPRCTCGLTAAQVAGEAALARSKE